jgi:glycosyltransferase involved in cell wall biosynthesis
VNPSPNESFSIVTLEAMAQSTPVLVNNASTVLADHIKDSGAGRVYNDYETFAHALTELSANESLLTNMGQRGRDYVLTRYQPDIVRKSLIAAIESV